MENAINKLRIISLKDPSTQLGGNNISFGQVAGFLLDTLTSRIFEVQINPEQITRNFSIKYREPAESGTQGSEFQFEKVNPEELELKFILDGTGTVLKNDIPAIDTLGAIMNELPPEAQAAYVPLKIAQLQATVYDFYDENHRTPFVLVNYGKLVFMGVLLSMSTNYNLFNPAGIPLRAEVTLKLKSQSVPKEQSALLSLLSPDLTRHHVVKGGDNILRICEEVYEDEKYYLEIAKANGLTNFRRLEPGRNLILPPINKTTPA